MRARYALAALLLVSAVGCNRGEARPGLLNPPPPEPVRCPLTGELAPEGFPDDLPAVAVKVDNAPAARPHLGLELADVVYEELVEGGITRFLAVFHCNSAGQIAPVRSARLVDPDILREYAPVLFGYSGAAPQVRNKVNATEDVVNLEERTNGASYNKLPTRFAPHNLAVSTESLRALSEVTGAPETSLSFDANLDLEPETSPEATPSPTKPPGSSISFSYLGSVVTRYAYDEGSSSYLRFHDDEPHLTAAGSQLSAVNVLVLKVVVREGRIRDAAGNASPEISVVGEGEAFVLRGGVATVGRWQRPTLSDHTTLVDTGGSEITLLPGNVWIHLLPVERSVDLR